MILDIVTVREGVPGLKDVFFLVSRSSLSSRMGQEMNIPTTQASTYYESSRHVEVSLTNGGRREASRLKRGKKPYARSTKSKNSLNHSHEDNFLSTYMNLTNGQIVEKFGKINSTPIAASPAWKRPQRLQSSKSSKSCLKRRRGADQNSIVKEVDSQNVIKREKKKWKKLIEANQLETVQEKAKIKYGQQGKTYLECAIDEVMKEFQKITIQETWHCWTKDEIL